MNVGDFEMISKLVKERSGLLLSEDKAYLLASRLNPVARHGTTSRDLTNSPRRSVCTRTKTCCATSPIAMTTNESFFFRDAEPFDQFRDLILDRPC